MPLKSAVVRGYDVFWKTVREMESEATKKNLPFVVIVKSSPEPDGQCWCRDCAIMDRMLKEKLESMHLNGLLVMGEAGTLDEWLEVDNPFKQDKVLKLAQIPTAYRWKDGKPLKRLEAPDLFNPEKFKSLFSSRSSQVSTSSKRSK